MVLLLCSDHAGFAIGQVWAMDGGYTAMRSTTKKKMKILETILAVALALGMAGQTKAQNMSKVPTIKLNNGIEMPQLGVGTFLVTGEEAPGKIAYALRHG